MEHPSSSSSSSLPLYNTIKKELGDKINEDLTIDEYKKLASSIGKLDQTGKDRLYSLIRAHSLLYENTLSSFEIPYKGKIIKNRDDKTSDIQFILNKFPTALKQILYRFIILHLQHLKFNNDMKSQ